MQHIEFTCKVITPLILNGALGKDPDLRPPAIKASMRYWWRALHGHLSIKNLDDLRVKENEIFGSTEKRSSILIKVFHPTEEEIYTTTKLLPHKNNFESNSIGRGVKFKVRLSIVAENTIPIDKLKNLFLITTIIGGLGKRGRRGFGALLVTKIDNNPYETPVNIKNLFDIIDNIVPNYYQIENEIIIAHKYNNPQYKVEYPVICKIQIGKIAKTVKDISSATHDIKSNYKDYGTSIGSGSPRLASPIYVSMIAGNIPIITTLTLKPKQGRVNVDIQNKLKDRILEE
jgi:CRISPR-associated protein Cmr1